MRIIARYTPWEITLLAEGGHLRLLPGEPALKADGPWPQPDVTLAGTPLALMALQREDAAAVIRRGDVTLTVLADALRKLPEFVEATYEGEAGGDGPFLHLTLHGPTSCLGVSHSRGNARRPRQTTI